MYMKVVVARYNEDVEWTKEFPDVNIYNKGEEVEVETIKLENVGREGHTYYRYICDNYENLEDYTIFLQGNPFDHSPDIMEEIRMYMKKRNLNINYANLSAKVLRSNISGCRYHDGIPMKEVYEKLFNEKKESLEIQFGVGAQFIVSRNQILKRSKEFYMKIVEMLGYDKDPIEGYVIERFHKLIFSG